MDKALSSFILQNRSCVLSPSLEGAFPQVSVFMLVSPTCSARKQEKNERVRHENTGDPVQCCCAICIIIYTMFKPLYLCFALGSHHLGWRSSDGLILSFLGFEYF